MYKCVFSEDVTHDWIVWTPINSQYLSDYQRVRGVACSFLIFVLWVVAHKLIRVNMLLFILLMHKKIQLVDKINRKT